MDIFKKYQKELKMLCKLCSSATNLWQHSSFEQQYAYCQQCELIAQKESYNVSLEREKQQYDQHNNSFENEGYVAMFETFLDFFWNEFTCKDISCLDFGSGPVAVLSSLMQKRGAHVDYYYKFYQPKRVFEEKCYDLITSTEVFEHLDNPLETLNLLTQHLKPKGYIALMTLFHDNSMENFWKWWYRRDPTHITFYTLKTMAILGNTCGLNVVKTDAKRVVLLQKR